MLVAPRTTVLAAGPGGILIDRPEEPVAGRIS
jgi:hypothetical protein